MLKRYTARILAAIFDKRCEQSVLEDKSFFARSRCRISIDCARYWQASQQIVGQSADEAQQTVRTKLCQQGMEIQFRNALAILIIKIDRRAIVDPHRIFQPSNVVTSQSAGQESGNLRFEKLTDSVNFGKARLIEKK